MSVELEEWFSKRLKPEIEEPTKEEYRCERCGKEITIKAYEAFDLHICSKCHMEYAEERKRELLEGAKAEEDLEKELIRTQIALEKRREEILSKEYTNQEIEELKKELQEKLEHIVYLEEMVDSMRRRIPIQIKIQPRDLKAQKEGKQPDVFGQYKCIVCTKKFHGETNRDDAICPECLK